MLNQLFTTADIAADHRRTLLAEAAAHRLARAATAAQDTPAQDTPTGECASRLPKLALPRRRRARGAT